MDEIERARRAHISIPNELKTSPIILKRPETQILHSISPDYSFSGIPEDWDETTTQMAMLSRGLSGKKLILNNPYPDKTEMGFRKKWFNGGDHELLQEIMKAGRIPLAWPESWSPNDPRTVKQALLASRELGYSVPDQYLENSDKISYSEAEAFYAAYMFVSGGFTYWRNNSNFGDIRDIIQDWNNIRSSVCQLTCQFIIPDPLDYKKIPYLLDQLWIFATSEQQVRLIGLEIDGEIHLDKSVQERSLRRDIMLAAKGYEIYHVAGWWCRIDPYRVICEFLNASEIFPNAQNYILGNNLKSIHDYKCQICNKPMVRWDVDSIQESNCYGQKLLAHRDCAEKAAEECY